MSISLSPEDRKELKMVVGELTNCLLQIDAQREAMKDAINDASKKYDIDKKQLRKLATTMFKHNYTDVQAEHEDFEFLYESIVEGNANIKLVASE